MPRYHELNEDFRRWLDNEGYTFTEVFYEEADLHNKWTQKELAAIDLDTGAMLMSL